MFTEIGEEVTELEFFKGCLRAKNEKCKMAVIGGHFAFLRKKVQKIQFFGEHDWRPKFQKDQRSSCKKKDVSRGIRLIYRRHKVETKNQVPKLWVPYHWKYGLKCT